MKKQPKLLNGYDAYTSAAARFADYCAVVIAGWLAFFWRFDTLVMPERYLWGIVVGVLLSALILPHFGIYRSWRGNVRGLLLVRLIAGYAFIGAALALVMFFTKSGANFSRLWVGFWLASATFLSIFFRAAAYPILNKLRAKGKNRRKVLLIGDAHSCATAYEHLERVPSSGFDVERIFVIGDDKNHELYDLDFEPYQVGDLIEHDEEEVWICLPISQGETVKKIQASLSLSTGNVRYMPNMQDFRLINHSISNVADLFLLDLSCSPMSGWSRFIKRAEDRVLSFIILLLICPIMLAVALGVKLSSPGPVFYKQERVGLNGKPFMMLKFRSMPVDVEKNGVTWGGAKEKKTTAFGAFIRKTSLDELPQLINVLKGDMSIVGPRPERTVFVEKFKHEVPGYMQKHMMKAGITGWAQINGWRGDTDLTKRIECDLWYIENWSLWLDVKIIFATAFKVFFDRNAY